MKKKTKKNLLITGVVLLAVAGAGVATWQFGGITALNNVINGNPIDHDQPLPLGNYNLRIRFWDNSEKEVLLNSSALLGFINSNDNKRDLEFFDSVEDNGLAFKTSVQTAYGALTLDSGYFTMAHDTEAYKIEKVQVVARPYYVYNTSTKTYSFSSEAVDLTVLEEDFVIPAHKDVKTRPAISTFVANVSDVEDSNFLTISAQGKIMIHEINIRYSLVK